MRSQLARWERARELLGWQAGLSLLAQAVDDALRWALHERAS
ncbi:hypothetical protein [Streptomyces sp. UG1]